jgi:cation transport ATPase
MSERPRHEKNEKEEEKRREKEEKSWEEKWQRDPISVVVWALIFLWAGLVLLGNNLGISSNFTWWNSWALIFAGAGVLAIIGALIRLAVPGYRRPIAGTFIIGIVFLGIGLGEIIGWSVVWPIVLIAIALLILVFGFRARRRR